MRTILALLLLTGCAADVPNGVWVAFVEDLENDEPVDPTITFNYNDAQPFPEDTTPDEWTDEDISDLSPQVLFLEIFDVQDVDGDFQKTMVADGNIFLGVEEDDGTWTFSWTYSDDDTFTATHTSGYTYTEHTVAQMVWSINLDVSGDVGTGNVRIDIGETVTWDESDLWDALETGTNNGETPSDDYLEHISDGSDVDNDGDVADCAAAICNLSVAEVDGGGAPITMRATDLTHDEFEAVYGAEQPAGIPDLF